MRTTRPLHPTLRPAKRSVARALALLAVLPVGLALPQEEEEPDALTLTNEEVLVGKVAAEEFSGLKFESGGKTQAYTWDKVEGIEYGDAPDLAAAISAISAGRLEDARAQLEGLESFEKLRPVVRQEVLFHLGWIHQRTGQVDLAVAKYQELLDAFPNGRYLRLAADNLAACLIAKSDAAGALAALDKLAKAGGDVQQEMELAKAQVLEATESFDEAKKIFESLQSAARAPVAQEARLGVARQMIRDGKKSEAETLLRQVVDQSAPPLVQVGAWNGLGQAFSEEGKAKRDSEKILDGLYSYLRGVVQFKPKPGEPTGEYERALAGAARCFRYISELEQNAERKKLFANRAQQHLQRLKNEYPQSVHLDTNP